MDIPHFTADKLIEIYEASGRALNIDQLQTTAKQLYPDVLEPDGRAPIFLLEKSFKGFRVDGIGIMDDGTPISYDK